MCARSADLTRVNRFGAAMYTSCISEIEKYRTKQQPNKCCQFCSAAQLAVTLIVAAIMN